jgi:cyclopropane fatty-acyl-phospholipid synthase-like methyltransferase
MADHMGSAYLRYSFTKGTVQEVDHIISMLNLKAGMRVLDVGCGPGRHAYELARRGITVHGIDISQTFVDLARESAPAGATFERMDARSLEFDGEFDAAICLCQGAFGLMTANGHDIDVLRGIRRALKEVGGMAMSAFNAYFAVKYFEQATFDAGTGVSHEVTEIRNQEGAAQTVDLWTGCYTPRELRLMLSACDFEPPSISSVDPGGYVEGPATTESSEFLVVAFATPVRRMGTR